MRLDEASVALSVRLQNGLLGEAFIGLRQHLAAVAAAAPPAAAADLQQRHAQLLLGQLLQFAAATKPPVVSAVARLPFGAVEEQVGGRGFWASVGWRCVCVCLGGKVCCPSHLQPTAHAHNARQSFLALRTPITPPAHF